MKLILFIIAAVLICASAYQPIARCSRALTSLNFNKEKDNGSNKSGNSNKNPFKSIWQGIKRFIPNVSKAKYEETYSVPVPDSGYRYHIRLVQPKTKDRRHVITRIQRYFPDIQWQTAEIIVDTALENGVSLVRVLNSLKEAEYAVDMLRKADPPVKVEIYDSKIEEVLTN
eukprot:gene11550-15470_t